MSYTYPEALSALESIANDLLKAMGVNTIAYVTCNSAQQTACVTWSATMITIYLPSRPAASRMSEAEFQDWVSYLLHETGHPTFTDKAAWEAACKAGLGKLTNAIEDVRMEKALIGSGKAANAKAVLSRLLGRKIAEARANGWRPNSRKSIGWTLCVLGRAANGYAFDASDMAWIKSQIVAGSTVDGILAWALPEMAAATSTADCSALAAKVAAAIAVPPQDGPTGPVDWPGSEQGKDDGDDGEAPQDAPEGREGGNDGDGGEGGDGETGEGGEAVDGEGGEGKSTPEEGRGGNGHGDGSKTEAKPADETPVTNERDLDSAELAPEGEALSGPEAATERYVTDILREVAKNDGKPDWGMQDRLDKSRANSALTLKDAASRASRQRALLARALRANETEDREGGRRSDRLDRGALCRAMAGSPNVFAKRETSEGFDTDVCILVDGSGSMGGPRMPKAAEAALIVAQACASVGANYTVEVFNSNGFARIGDAATRRLPNVQAFSKLNNAPAGGTPLSTNIARAAMAQAKRAPQKRRVLFVITDGSCDYGPHTVRRIVAYCEQTYGTVMAHVSIETPLAKTFRAEVRVERQQSMADVGVDHFTKVLQAL